MTLLRVLIIEDSEDDALLIIDYLRHGGFDPRSKVVDDLSDLESALSEEWDIIISDYVLTDFTGLDALKLAHEKALDTPFLIVSGRMGEDVAVDTMMAGAHDYILKNNLARLAPAIDRELREAQIRRERRLALTALAESEERYRTLFEHSNDGIIVIQDGVIQLANWRFSEISGYTIEELTNSPFTSFLPPDEATMLYDNYMRRIAGEDVPSIYEAAITRQGGIKLDIEISANVISYKGKRADIVILRDVTERKASQRELEDARDKAEQAAQSEAETRATLQAIFDASPVGLLTVDAATQEITYFNAAAAGILGGPIAGLGGLPAPDSYQLLHLDGTPYEPDETPMFRPIVKGERCLSEQALVRRRDGTEVNVYVTCAPVLDAERRITGAVATLDDVTEMADLRKEIEEALERERHFSLLLQRALLPTEPQIGPGYDVAAEYAPMFASREIGGDFYDVFRVGDCRAGGLIGDVSGKGLEAAAMAATTRSTIHAFVHETASAAEALARANAVLYSRQAEFGSFATVFLVIINLCTGETNYSSAGHPPAVICRSDGTVELLKYGQMPLAIIETQSFKEHHIAFEPGDKIVLYTDGISEAHHGPEMLDIEGIERVLVDNCCLSPSKLAHTLLSTATEYANGKLTDDAAVVVVERVE